MSSDPIAQLADFLAAGPVVALTGAGISTESGIPDFRSPGGLYERMDPMEYLSTAALERTPEKFWRGFAGLYGQAGDYAPNRGHRALARLEAAGRLRGVVTQNIDGLHQRAGSRQVVELHGHLRTVRCMRCPVRTPLAEAVAQVAEADRPWPRCPACEAMQRPDVVLFGDMLEAFEEARRLVAGAGRLLVVGSSLSVSPANGLVLEARETVIVNRDPTDFDRLARLCLRAGAGETLEALCGRLGLEG